MAKKLQINPNDFRIVVAGLYNSPLALEALRLANPEKSAEIDSIVADIWQQCRFNQAMATMDEVLAKSVSEWYWADFWNIVNIGNNPKERYAIVCELFDRIYMMKLRENIATLRNKYQHHLVIELFSIGLKVYTLEGSLAGEIFYCHDNDFKSKLEFHHVVLQGIEIERHINFVAMIASLCEDVDYACDEIGKIAQQVKLELEGSEE